MTKHLLPPPALPANADPWRATARDFYHGLLGPSEVYNLAAQSFVPRSWEQPIGTFEANGLPVISLLEAIRATDVGIRFFQASSAQMFGQPRKQPCSEQTPFRPGNPYAVSKFFAHMMTVNYRESHGVFAATGILFNHESPLRPPWFVSRKISSGVARIKQGEQKTLALGDLSAVRDWGVRGRFRARDVAEPSGRCAFGLRSWD